MHIVIVNRWPRFHDARRWDNELTQYETFFDHQRDTISYVVDAPGAAGVLAPRDAIAHQIEIGDVNDYAQLLDAVAAIAHRVGPVDRLIALSEFTLEVAARVRAELGIPGHTPDDVARYRDKVRMKEVLAEAGIAVPRFARCTGTQSTLAFADAIGYPLILKPVDGAASIGVVRIDDRTSLAAKLADVQTFSRYEIEEFIAGDIYHVDGFVDAQGSVPFQAVSRYINSCLDFAESQPLGSVLVQHSALRERIERFSAACIAALDLTLTPFHLELFVRPDGELVFLEVGARVGGSEVPHLINKVFGVNLYEHWLRGLGGTPIEAPVKRGDPSGGWLVIPKPRALPCRVLHASPMRSRVSSIWRELIPAAGDVLEPGGSYDALHSGRFIFTGRAEADIEADIRAVIDTFEFDAVAL
ncbi:ATP-grasp domain-containing protein [Burkholderia territorii]|uniref:ATP-grasp domain-containing protein n=1 Tax=Burkholderia territorii TaxID=1503055 RepID=A0A6L3NQM7_9BURK|nr:ATP-grasp domain-containing protein [Burkholderia territorii]KAB0686476.1 ATP-grasp domain-containing protein [Burkholderia territorii]MBM2775686.1 ATP-grasp domain-containing protein [Burkholderia territorii]VWB69963.1 ATP-dependent carboxylate-amine ligase domain-containing protein [Burkholderia territorii]